MQQVSHEQLAERGEHYWQRICQDKRLAITAYATGVTRVREISGDYQSKLSPNTVLLDVLGLRARMKTKACLAITVNLHITSTTAQSGQVSREVTS